MLNTLATEFPTTLAQAADGETAKAIGGRTLFEFIHSGGILSYVLVCVSIVALGLVIANLIILRRSRLSPVHVISGLERLFKERNVQEAMRFCSEEENDSFLARTIGGGLAKATRYPNGLTELRGAMEESGTRELDRLEKITQGIGIIASVGPMLGLLGTVIGMIGAFATIGSLEGASRSHQLAGYMSIALVATAEGLVVAIPCTIAFALFKRRTDRLVAEVGETAERLVAPLYSVGAPPVTKAAPSASASARQGASNPPAVPASSSRGVPTS